MPFVYVTQSAMSGALGGNFATSGTANSEVDCYFLKPGTRNIWVNACYVGGKGAGLTAISGIAYRFRKWITTSSAAGVGVIPVARDPGAQAAKATSGMASAGVTSGTGGPSYLGGFVSGAAGPGGWVAPNPDSMMVLEGSANMSIDLFNISGTASLNFEFTVEHQE
jgi:hypothetical protein